MGGRAGSDSQIAAGNPTPAIVNGQNLFYENGMLRSTESVSLELLCVSCEWNMIDSGMGNTGSFSGLLNLNH